MYYSTPWFTTLTQPVYIFFFLFLFGVALPRDDVVVILLIFANLAKRLRIVSDYVLHANLSCCSIL